MIKAENREQISYEYQKRLSAREESLSAKAREAAIALKELARVTANKTKAIAVQKTGELKQAASADADFAKDAADIQMLGEHIDSITAIFEETMNKIRQAPYGGQQALLSGLKTLYQEEIYVINARLNLAKIFGNIAPLNNTRQENNVESYGNEQSDRQGNDSSNLGQDIQNIMHKAEKEGTTFDSSRSDE